MTTSETTSRPLRRASTYFHHRLSSPSCRSTRLGGPMADAHRLAQFDADLEGARSVSREAIFRITLLSASIVAFSATLLSIKQIDLQADRGKLGAAWALFAAVVVLGPLSIGLEARAKFVVAWRSFQPQAFACQTNRRPSNTINTVSGRSSAMGAAKRRPWKASRVSTDTS